VTTRRIAFVLAAVVGLVIGAALTSVWYITPRLRSEGDFLTVIGLLVALATFLLVAVQIWIASRQTDLQNREIKLVKEQGQLFERQEKQMNQKAHLVLWSVPPLPVGPTGMPSNEAYVMFHIFNDGTKTAAACRILLLHPPGFGGFAGKPQYDWKEVLGSTTVNGLLYRRASLNLQDLFFQNSVNELTRMRGNYGANVEGPILYRLVYADGATPSHTGWLELKGTQADALRIITEEIAEDAPST
jgi:uncharacterized membrane protein (DUF485 family)